MISPPYAYIDYCGPVKLTYKCPDGTSINSSQACGLVPKRPVGYKFDEDPQIIIQAVDHGQRDNGPAWVYEPTLDHGRGTWVTYVPELHDKVVEPEVVEPEVVEPKTISLGASSKIELDGDVSLLDEEED